MKFKGTKQFAAGVAAGLVLSVTFTAAAASKILSADYNDVSVSVNGQPLAMEQPLISVIDEENPAYFSNYMPLTTVLKQLGYAVTWDGTNGNIDLAKNEQTAVSPDVIEADVSVDGADIDWTISLMEVPVDGKVETMVSVHEVLGLIETKEMPLRGSYDAATNTLTITTKAPFAEGKPIREVLNATGIPYEVIPGENNLITIELTSGSATATASFVSSGDEPGKIVSGDKSAEFDFYLSQGATYIVEQSFLQALKDIGIMK